MIMSGPKILCWGPDLLCRGPDLLYRSPGYQMGARDIKSLYFFNVAAGYFGQLCAGRVALHATVQYN